MYLTNDAHLTLIHCIFISDILKVTFCLCPTKTLYPNVLKANNQHNLQHIYLTLSKTKFLFFIKKHTPDKVMFSELKTHAIQIKMLDKKS